MEASATGNLSQVAKVILSYRDEAEDGKRKRMERNEENFQMYNLDQDFSHKQAGQSKEILAKQSTAVEQLTNFLQQGLVDKDDWFSIENEDGIDPEKQEIAPLTMKKLLARQLKKVGFDVCVADALKSGFLGSLMIIKTGGCKIPTLTNIMTEETDEGEEAPKLVFKNYWQLKLDIVRHEDFFPDPTGDGLYEVERVEMDKFKLLQMAKQYPEFFDYEACLKVQATPDELQVNKKANETGQNATLTRRKRVVIWECWGTLVDPTTGEVIKENCWSAVSDDGYVVIPPVENPWWHQQSPYVYSPIIRVPKSVWHKALMDAPTKHNRILNEVYNLCLDSGLSSVHGIKQVRTDWLADPSQIDDGIAPGTTLLVNSKAPAGTKVLERVDTGGNLVEGMQMLEVTDREFNQSALTNDTRLGALPARQVKATEITASNQSINNIFNGIASIIEGRFILPLLERCWLAMAQHMNDLDSGEVEAMIGEQQAALLRSMSKAKIFASTALGRKFKVFGLSTTLSKINDFRKLTSLLQTISASPDLLSSFQAQYSSQKLLGEIVKSLDIDLEKIKADPQEAAAAAARQQMFMQMTGGGTANAQSQIPQMSADKGAAEGPVSVPRRDLMQNSNGVF